MQNSLNQPITFNFYRGWRELTSFYKDVLGNDMHPHSVFLLGLCDVNDKVTINQLAESLELKHSSISTLVTRMEKKGLVKRVQGKVDRRIVFVVLTEKGDDLKKKLSRETVLLNDSITNNISDNDMNVLQSIVTTITENRKPVGMSADNS